MSVDRKIYVGPYVECQHSSETTNTDELVQSFKEWLVTVHGNAYERYSKKNRVDLWISNWIPFGDKILKRVFSFDPDEVDFVHIPMELFQPDREVDQFHEFYKKELVHLRRSYGEENVRVTWGVIHMTW